MPADESATWLLAAWPGMGSVAITAATHIVQQFDSELLEELDSAPWFPLTQVEVHDGLATAGHRPRNLLFRCRGSLPGQELLVFIGEAQPAHDGFGLCSRVIELARSHGATHCVTCAAMASQVHPADDPRVFVAATDRKLAARAQEAGGVRLHDGQISGLNGLLLAAAADQEVEALCLLGEMPFYATEIPQPKASIACLRVLTRLLGLGIDLHQLQEHARRVERQLVELVERLQIGSRPRVTGPPAKPTKPAAPDEAGPQLEPSAEWRIEQLFEQAATDRSKALALKQELDRHGVFEHYEDRFLDLFKKGE